MSTTQPSTRQILAAGLAKRRGISEEEAMAVLTALDQKEETDRVQTFMSRVKDNVEVLRELDPSTRTSALQLFANAGPPGDGDDMKELKKMMREVTIIKETMRGDSGGGEVQKKLDELTKTIADMKAEEQAKKIDMLSTTFQTQLKELEERMSGQIAGIAPLEEGGSGVSKFIGELKELKATQTELLDTLGVKPEGSGGSLDASAAAETLKKLGYKVEGPKTLEDIERMMDDRVKKAVEETAKKTKEDLKSDEKKMAMLVDFGSSLIDGFMPALTEGQGANVATNLNVAKKALQAATATNTK